MGTITNNAVVRRAAECERINITPLEQTRLLFDRQDGSPLDIFDLTMQPGAGPPVHVHAEGEELFVVLDGSVSIRLGTDTVELAAGDACLIPRGTAHAPFNPNDTAARAMVIGTPNGFAEYFRGLEEIVTDWPPTDAMLAAAGPLMQRHAVEMVGPPPLPEAAAE